MPSTLQPDVLNHLRDILQNIRMMPEIRTFICPILKFIDYMSNLARNTIRRRVALSAVAPEYLCAAWYPRIMAVLHDGQQDEACTHQASHVVPQAMVAMTQRAHVQDLHVAFDAGHDEIVESGGIFSFETVRPEVRRLLKVL